GIALLLLLGCGERPAPKPVAPPPPPAGPADTLVLTAPGFEVWFTAARTDTGADGHRCTERSIEIRQGSKRTLVPLLYTGAVPTRVNDSTIRADLWALCQPSEGYRVGLGDGQPVAEHRR
ncbi:MAG: hypothetical protein ACHQXA_05070, partial [Gemmatimonadales bacterium]